MKLQSLTPTLYDHFVAFNKVIYPERKHVQELLKFRTIQCPNKEDMSLNIVIQDDDDNIVGQTQYNSTKYYHQGETKPALWGFDLIVCPAFRKLNYGLDLLEYAYENRTQTTFASGVGKTALRIEQAILGSKVMGNLKKSIKIVNLFNLFFAIHRNVKSYPEKVNGYTRVNSCNDLWNRTKPYNESLLEFCRDREFLMWRFFEAPHTYALYKSNVCENYFVVRTISKKHITALVLVDYRCDINQLEQMKEIVSAAENLTRKLRLPLLITASSTTQVDDILQTKSFKVVGRDRPMTINRKMNDHQQNIENRSFVFVTLADSDGEINW